MRKPTLIVYSLAVAVAVSYGGAAPSQQGYVVRQPGLVGAAQTINVKATIKAINQSSREVTLVGPEGKEVTVTAGPEVKNFAQLKSGDQVDVRYVEALTVELKKGGGAPVTRTEEKAMGSAKPGTPPGAVAGRQITVTGDVIKLDPATQLVTGRGPQRTIDLKVRDPEQFKLIATGDQLEATYMEAVAVDVSPAK